VARLEEVQAKGAREGELPKPAVPGFVVSEGIAADAPGSQRELFNELNPSPAHSAE
jgi:hypothetical protein